MQPLPEKVKYRVSRSRNGRACEQLGTPRGKMYLYMQSLRVKLGYTSLKTLYLEDEAKNFPSLNGADKVSSDMNEDEEALVPMNPIEQKDKKIATLMKENESLKGKDDEINILKEALTKSTAELKLAKKSVLTSQVKLNFTKKGYRKIPH